MGQQAGPRASVVLDEVALRDCRPALDTLGLTPHVVAQHTPVAQRVKIAAADSSALLLEQDRIPEGFTTLASPAELGGPKHLWYGLCQSSTALPEFSSPRQVWLALGPSRDASGSLHDILGLVAAAGIDLQHIRSANDTAGPHVFFLSFVCDSEKTLRNLGQSLSAAGVRHRVLAAIAGAGDDHGPSQVTARWT